MSGQPPGPGSRFGRYQIEQTIGLGGMGMVFSAQDVRLGRRVAVKVVLGHYAESDAFLERFQREAAVLAHLDSPHVVSIYDHGEQDGHPYIVTQYAAGGDLGRRIRERGAMPPGLAGQLCSQIADALVAAHAVGVIHRDVKPANVLLRDDRLDHLHVYLCDFGVALSEGEEASGLTSPGSVAGTWNYLAPERVDGERGSPASDVYAVGCLLWEALTGRPPYLGSDVEVALEHVRSPVPQLPGDDEFTRAANRVLALSMAKDPADRYPSAAALRDDLRTLTAIVGGPDSASDLAPLASRRRRRIGWIAAATVGMLLVGGGVAVAVTRGGPSPTPVPAPTGAPTGTVGHPPPIQGDIDGNGFGDLAWTDQTRGYLHLSDGHRLAADAVRRSGASEPTLEGDVDGDGRNDLVNVGGKTPTLSVTVVSPRNTNPTTTLTVPRDFDETADPTLALADVNGDGRADLVIATRQHQTTTISVALSRGDLTFAPATTWWTGSPDVTHGGLAVADFDGDGNQDIAAVALSDDTEGSNGVLRILASRPASDGTGKFVAFAAPLRLPEQIGGDFVSISYLAIGDVDGDGAPDVIAVDPFQPEVVVWRWGGTSFAAPRVWYRVGGYGSGGSDRAALSDVNGDGRTDVALISDKTTRLLISNGHRLVLTPSWQLNTPAPAGDPVIGTATWSAY